MLDFQIQALGVAHPNGSWPSLPACSWKTQTLVSKTELPPSLGCPLPHTHNLLCFFLVIENYSTISSLLRLEMCNHLTPSSPNPLVFSQLCQVHPALYLFSDTSFRVWSLTFINVLTPLLFSHLTPTATYVHIIDITAVFIFRKLKALARTREIWGPSLGQGN